MLGGQAVLREQYPHPAGPSQPGGQLAVAAKRPELEASTMHEHQHLAGVDARGVQPVGWHPAGGHLRHQHVVRRWVDTTCGGEAGAELVQRRRGLAARWSLKASIKFCIAGLGMAASPLAWAPSKPADDVPGRAWSGKASGRGQGVGQGVRVMAPAAWPPAAWASAWAASARR